MIDDRTRRVWVAGGEILGIDPPLRLELYDSEAYLREIPASNYAPRRHEFVLVTSNPLRDRCLQLRILTPERLPVVRPDGTPLAGFALSVSSDRRVSLLYDAQTTEMTFDKGGSGPVGHTCAESPTKVTQAHGEHP